jgi:hypothetical protein
MSVDGAAPGAGDSGERPDHRGLMPSEEPAERGAQIIPLPVARDPVCRHCGCRTGCECHWHRALYDVLMSRRGRA